MQQNVFYLENRKTTYNQGYRQWFLQLNQHSCPGYHMFASICSANQDEVKNFTDKLYIIYIQLVLPKIYPPLPTSVQPISITKTLLVVPTKNERDPPFFTSKLLIKFQNILRNITQVIIRHRVKIIFSVISSPITLEQSVMFWLWKQVGQMGERGVYLILVSAISWREQVTFQ